MSAEQMFKELGYEKFYYDYEDSYDNMNQPIKYRNKRTDCWIEFFTNYVEGYELDSDGITEHLKGFTYNELRAIIQQFKELGAEV